MNTILSRLTLSWGAMEPRRRAMLAVGAIALVIVLGLFARIVSQPTMALLYSGLDSAAASGVIEGLERQGVSYEVRGDAIYVASDVRDRVRITLAGEGLPAAGEAGYELLDGLSGFGTTAEMFDAAYWRAKEGELARTILASHRVIRARVHIAQAKRRPFEREKPVTASATVTTSSGALGRKQAEAIRYLVASAVSGLSIQNVAVIDQENGVILRSGETESDAGDDTDARARALQESVTRLLEARVGAGGAIVEVALETQRASETLRERLLDPESRVAIHTDTEESTDSANGAAGAVTVASNLPDGDVEGGDDKSTRESAKTRERVNFEVSETVRETVRPAGAVSRITVAVMVDGVRSDDGWEPRPAEELDALRDLVESAVGYDEARGDRVTIESMEFVETAPLGTVAEAGITDVLAANAMSLIQIATLALVALMLGLFVVRPILSVAGPVRGEDEDFPLLSVGQPGEALSIPPGEMIDADALSVDGRALLESVVAEKPEEAIRLLGLWLDDDSTATEGA
ncbi:flagellar basal-body MS-ring/collar protein FliF [Pikeienuella piscinae]|uniref:flagellar basal-body MS-ring/collar protein FliF n=1 Tax=Pikeienuella piscinae TaxID=2748098 RepID=UPI001FECE82C|nr:flagellar basal-body MS-ring/collar protein FliF [Pikeienuella piscinae]